MTFDTSESKKVFGPVVIDYNQVILLEHYFCLCFNVDLLLFVPVGNEYRNGLRFSFSFSLFLFCVTNLHGFFKE